MLDRTHSSKHSTHPRSAMTLLTAITPARGQFMHFGIPTFWNPPEEYLYGKNPTYHDCGTTTIDHGNQTGSCLYTPVSCLTAACFLIAQPFIVSSDRSYYPCLDPNVFHPTDLNADDWMAASAALGTKEIIITAHHEVS